MPLYGEGVTRNFLTILEYDTQRTRKSVIQTVIVAALVLGLAWLFLADFGPMGFLIVPGVFLASLAAGLFYTRHVVLGSYEVSLRDHWNRWMRWSASCRTVRECYAKVHGRSSGPSWVFGGIVLAALILFHLVFLSMALYEAVAFTEVLPVFALDGALVGFFLGRRLLERRWYRRFLRSCNELLQDGAIGLWGIY